MHVGAAGSSEGLHVARPVTPDALPEPVSTGEIFSDRDPEEVRRACRELYGPSGTHRVTTAECVRDAQEVSEAFVAAGLEVPAGLLERHSGTVGNVMTPRRLLTACYSSDGAQGNAGPKPPRTLLVRLQGRGGGRPAVLGLLALGPRR